MITYNEFTAFSNVQVSETDFPKVERTAVDILSCLCRNNWDTESDICKKAVMYQIEHMLSLGGLASWSEGKGVVGSHSYSVGGESERVTYVQSSKESENSKLFNGVSISPIAWALLLNEGILKTLHGVRVW